MQLKSLLKGRFQHYWYENQALIEKIFLDCQVDRRMVVVGDFLMQQGQKVNQLYLVDQGVVSLAYNARNGRRFQLGMIECDEQLFGEMEFFTGYPCQLDIVAEDDIIVSVISGEKLERALVHYPQLALCFSSAIAVDYQDTIDIFLRRMLYSISYNIAYDLYQQHLHGLPMGSFSKSYMEAERFATSDRVYRRAVKQLMDLGLVEKGKQGLEIKNLSALKQFLTTHRHE